MSLQDVLILIPSHSLEDFPTDLGDEEAAGLLNAFAVAWHPLLLAETGALPGWERSDEPPEELAGRLFLVPTACEEWIPGGWADHARGEGATVVSEIHDRDELTQAVLEPLERTDDVDPDLTADFFALGTCYLQMELLTRHMHYFSNLDEVHIQREAVAASEAAVANDAQAARTHLQTCFEELTEARERFYPVDCYLIDLCLLLPRLADDHFRTLLVQQKPVNVLAQADDLDEMAAEIPDLTRELREAWHRGTADVVGGEKREAAVPLLPLSSLLWEFEQGHASFRRIFGRTPTTWGRRRFGLATLLPQILNKFGCHSALHGALDDGLYPDEEQSKIRWEGCDGTVLDALSRIPLPADSAASYLRFPMRMAESMEEDQVAAVVFARWPEVKTPWFEDFRRIHNYSPALGRFVTLDDFFGQTDMPGRLTRFEDKDYLSPFLIHAVAREETNPISRFTEHVRRRRLFDAACWYRAAARALAQQNVNADDLQADQEIVIEQADPDGASEAVEEAEAVLRELPGACARQLADVVMQGAGTQSGYLVLNPVGFRRLAAVELPEAPGPPAVRGPVKAVQETGISSQESDSPDDQTTRRPDHQSRASAHEALVELPGAGFVWISDGTDSGEESPHKESPPVAQENLLRNEFFEVHINEATGGIQRVKEYGRRPNRLSQQLAFRFPRDRTVPPAEEGGEEITTPYSEMRCRSSAVTCSGPAVGEIVTTGEIVDQATQTTLAEFRQTFRLRRMKRVLEVDVELEPHTLPEGNPWMCYYAARFAWNDSTAALTRSVLEGAQGIQDGRFESLHYLEIAEDEQRTTILFGGLPFHRKTGPRMADTLLITAGETKRKFHFAVAVDEKYPMQAALDMMTPPAVLRTETGPPRVGETGWFFHQTARNVQIGRILPLMDEPPAETTHGEPEATDTGEPAGESSAPGFALRLTETEGRRARVKLRCFRAPAGARQRDFHGRTIEELTVEDDYVLIEMTPYEIAEVELRFGA